MKLRVLLGILLLSGCGGAVATTTFTDPPPMSADAGTVLPSNGGIVCDANTAVDAAPRDAGRDARPRIDAGTIDCECEDELVQIANTCIFDKALRNVACAVDLTPGRKPQDLDLFRSCIQNGPPSWTPANGNAQLELCNCEPGEVRRVCVAYR